MVSIRNATRDDAAGIRAVAFEAWPATYAGLLDEAFIAKVLERTYSETSLREQIAAAAAGDGACFLVAEEDGKVIGYLHYARGPQGPELHRLYVKPGLTGRGVGRSLLAELNARLDPGTEYLALVHAGNRGALRFYEREGFADAGRVDGRATYFARREGVGELSGGSGCDVLVRYRVPGQAAPGRPAATSNHT